MANEFKVKNGVKFPDNTVQTTAAVTGYIDPILLDLHGQADASNCVFTLRKDQTPLVTTFIKNSKDLEVVVDGEYYSPYASQLAYTFMPLYEADSRTFRVRENRLTIYNAPEIGAKIRVVVRTSSTTPQTRRYPFSASTIGLGD